MEKKLGVMSRITDLRVIWKNEASDFTPWLSNNLDLLGSTLNVNLELLEIESQVGGYSLDILAEDTDSGDTVIIENQLEQTDHDHLGKVITYASGKKAKKIVWIVKSAREEHKAAIEWLNENTIEGVQFFLVEIQLWKVDDSACAPRFEVIEQPNNWSRAMKGPSVPGGAAVQFKYNFWNEFNNYTYSKKSEFTKQFNQHKASSDHWYSLSIGSSRYYMCLLVNTPKSIVTVEFSIRCGDDNDKSFFDKLFAKKEVIEGKIGSELDWKRLDDKKTSRILLEKEVNLRDEANWNTIFEWYIEYAMIVYKAFKEFI